ncbi:leucyl aminopeptidase family protein [Lysobacter silvisoli]|uniref:Leucyl aminopeptidase family protein n=1 Tax=Lysobacter silvisoli TaxID=2293254 RepID=A0A371K0G0_9GAMM|nr:leucyl aminopeptidase family protein [Lysobacter silvisoli]RDZ27327.1 leucyl aminopeptidase family protein [Lysobacter silvisoli]
MNLPLGFTDNAADALPLHVVTRAEFAAWQATLPAPIAAWVAAQQFDASPGTLLTLPGLEGGLGGAVLGIGDPLDPYSYGHAPFGLPIRAWRVAGARDAAATAALQLGWGLGSYRFSRYRQPLRAPAQLLIEPGHGETFDLLAASLRVRDLINTPTEHMGPEQLQEIAQEIAQRHGAQFDAVVGDELLAQNFPAIHAVGRASHRAPRLLRLSWGDSAHPHVVLVGKGVCFDTGGLDLKPADGMRNMKKDMGGAAHAIALAELVMARKLPLRITLLVPAVENAVGPDAFRPGEVIATRQGISVEIDNTDAEGRVVLCDALTHAGELSPALVLDFATLTGAARIALGPDLPALYSNDDALALAWLDAGMHQRDPLWRMPLWRPYLRYLTSAIADIANGGPSKMAGSVTAALYLERFVPAGLPWAHLDVYSWNDSDRPGRPAGGEAQGLRAVYALLKARAGI